MKILITGATGLLGHRLTTLCLESGWDVHYLTTSKSKIKTSKNHKGFHWNPSTGEIDEKACEGITTIVHLAGASIAQRWTSDTKKKIKDSRIKSAQLLLDTLTRKNIHIDHFVSASAIGCYPSSYTTLYDESYEGYADGFLGEIIAAWEVAAQSFSTIGAKVSLMRTGIVFDSASGAFPKLVKPIQMRVGAPLGTAKQWQSWIHLEDAAAYYHHIIKDQLAGIFNVVAPYPVTNDELTHKIASLLKKPIFLPPVPAFMLRLFLGKMAAIVLESQQVSAQKAQDIGFTFQYDLETALQDCIDRLP